LHPAGGSIDVKACYNQYEYGESMWPLLCFKHKGKWWHLTRAAMGQRQTSAIAQCALKVISHGVKHECLKYIDNLKSAGNREELIADIVHIRERAKYCNMVFGEDLTKPEDLVVRTVPYIGMVLDHKVKTVQIVEKTIDKLRHMKEHRGAWSLEQFVSTGSLLMYCSLCTKRKLGKYQYALQHWSKAQRAIMLDARKKKQMWIEPDALKPVLTEWLNEAIDNLPVPVSRQGEKRDVDFYAITDASIDGFGGVVVSAKSGQVTCLSGLWGAGLRPYCASSARAEPLGMYCVLAGFFDQDGTRATVQHFGDNSGSEAITNKGYSTKDSQVVMELLQLPGIEVRSKWAEGASLPADSISRQRPLDREEMQSFCEAHGITIDQAEFGQILLSPTPKLF
jgi:hypothetical protein